MYFFTGTIIVNFASFFCSKQGLIDQLQVDVKQVRPSVEKTRPNTTKNPDVDRLEEDVNRMSKRWGNCCMQVRQKNTNAFKRAMKNIRLSCSKKIA